MYCKNCGKEIHNDAVICPECGVAQAGQAQISDTGGLGWGLLSCCIPIVGLVLFLVWRDTKPKTAKAAGIGALISVICIILFYVVVFAFGMMDAASMPDFSMAY